MRSTRTLIRVAILVGSMPAVLALGAPGASAQLPIEPTVTPTVNTGGWVYGMAVLIAVVGFVGALALIAGYLRFSRHFRQEQAASAPKVVRATPVYEGYEPVREPVLVSTPPSSTTQVPAPPPPPAPASAPAPRAAAPAPPTPATEPAPAEAAQAAAAPAAQAQTAPAPAPAASAPAAPAPAEHVDVEMDQEVFEAKLGELLEKGTDRRVAEGQARRAAMIAARKKAAGG